MRKPLRIGILGMGHLGKIHVKCIQSSKAFELAGVFDIRTETAREAANEYQTRWYDNLDSLIDDCDAIDIVTPTPTHFDLATHCIARGRHVFIEKPVAETTQQASSLQQQARSAGVKVQVGHVERFNPAYLAVQHEALRPVFIEAHRLAVFNPRGTDVSVVLDLMIHDIDLILQMVGSEVSQIFANGVPVVSHTPDICNARIEFANGAVANLTASRISMKQMRKIRLFQQDAYISLDLLEKKAQIMRLYDTSSVIETETEGMFLLDTGEIKKWIHLQQPDCPPVNAIEAELQSFARSILTDAAVAVSLADAGKALDIALEITQSMEAKLKTLRT